MLSPLSLLFALLVLMSGCVGELCSPIEFPSGRLCTADLPSFNGLSLRQRQSGGVYQWYIKLHADVSSRNLSLLEEHLQVPLTNYVPQNTFVVSGKEEVARRAQQSPLVSWVGLRQAHHKLSSEVALHPKIRGVASGNASEDSAATMLWVSMLEQGEHAPIFASEIRSRFNSSVIDVIVISGNKVKVTVRNDLLSSVVDWTSANFLVSIVEITPERKRRNRYVRHTIIEGLESPSTTAAWNVNKLWNMGITGTGQIIGVADSGIDPDNCFFQEDSGVSSFPKSPDFSRRKVIVNYVYSGAVCGNLKNNPCGDGGDDVIGHGTHVSGSAAGSISSRQSHSDIEMHSGVAKDARIAFTDIGLISDIESLYPPSDLNAGLFPDPYAAGVRIHTDSWGGNTNSYSSNTAEVDRFAWNHKDFLVLWAAGNDGNRRAEGTVQEPATCKNCISVGSSGTSLDRLKETINYFDPREPCSNGYQQSCCNRRDWTASTCRIDDCCSFSPELDNSCCLSKYDGVSHSQDVTPWSSRAYTFDGRFKPDLVVGGSNIISARSDGKIGGSTQCSPPASSNLQYNKDMAGIFVMSGTSMSSPLLAGGAALVRQYFVDGYYPTGAKNSANVVMPTAALLRAVIIASCVPLDGNVYVQQLGSRSVNLPLNIYAGYGHPNLGSVLRNPADDFKMWIMDTNATKLALHSKEAFTAKITGGRTTGAVSLRIVLAWTDYPAVSGQTASTLINDLDLSVQYGDNNVVLGNMFETRDSSNNNERVTLINIFNPTDITVTVTAAKIVFPQDFALFIVGYFDQVSSTVSTAATEAPISTDPRATTVSVATGATTARTTTRPVTTQTTAAPTLCGSATCSQGTCTVDADTGDRSCVCFTGFLGPSCATAVTSLTSSFVSSTSATIVSTNSGDSISFPVGSISSPLQLYISQVSADAYRSTIPGVLSAVSAVKDFQPSGQSFDVPVTISLKAASGASSSLSADQRLAVYYYNRASGEWERVGGSASSSNPDLITTQISHFSEYAVMKEPISYTQTPSSNSATISTTVGGMSTPAPDSTSFPVSIVASVGGVALAGLFGVVVVLAVRSRNRRAAAPPAQLVLRPNNGVEMVNLVYGNPLMSPPPMGGVTGEVRIPIVPTMPDTRPPPCVPR